MILKDQIDIINHGRPGSETALASVVAAGDAAVTALVERIEHGPGSFVAAGVLGFVEVPDRLARLDDLTRHPASEVRSVAIRVLGRTGDPRALPILERSYTTYTADDVVKALGDLGVPGAAAVVRTILMKEAGDVTAPDVLEALRARTLADLDPSRVMAVARGVEALAKLGDFSLLDLARGLTRFMLDDEHETYASSMVRQAAVEALDVSVGPGIATTIEQCYDDPGEDNVVWVALDAMLHLGRIAAVDRWIELLSSERTGVQHGALSCIERLIGEKPPHFRAQAESWWMHADRARLSARSWRKKLES